MDVDTAEHCTLFLEYDTREIIHDSNVVVAKHMKYDLTLTTTFRPFHIYSPVRNILKHVSCILAVSPVDSDSTTESDEPHNLVAINRIAALGKLIVKSLYVLVDDKCVAVLVGSPTLCLFKPEILCNLRHLVRILRRR